MTWQRFGYICRKASVDYRKEELISDCLSRIEGEISCSLYGKKIDSNHWARMILDKIGNIQDRNQACEAIAIYQGLQLGKPFEEPMRFKRIIAYLSSILFIFYIVSGIYHLKVAPSFLSAFENFGLSSPNPFVFYQDYWGHFVLVVSIFLLVALLIGFKMKSLFRFQTGVEQSFIVKYLVFPSITKSYRSLLEILQFPLFRASCLGQSSNSPYTRHLQEVEKSKMCVSTEMQELIEQEMQSILDGCEKQMKYISMAVALVVIAAIFLFLVSAYSPIFVLGEII